VALLASSTLPHPAVIVWDSTRGTGVGATDQEVTPVSPDMAVTQVTDRTQLFDVHSQRSLDLTVPAGTTILAGTLSPDGTLIAVAMTTETDAGKTELGVIDVRRRTLRALAGSVTSDGYWELQWSKTGDRLVAGDGQPRPGLIARISLYDVRRGKVRHWSVSGGPFTGFVIV
jgi:WD40 repeat protein